MYRSNNGYSVLDKNKKTNNYITFNIYKKQISKEFVEDSTYKLSAIDTTGKIKNEDIVNLFPKEKNMTIEDLYKLLRDNHDYDIEEGLEFARSVKEKGYKVSINPINIMGYSFFIFIAVFA